MAYRSVLVAIVTACLSAIAYGTLITIPEPNSSDAFSPDENSTIEIDLFSSEVLYPLATPSTESSTLITESSSHTPTREKDEAINVGETVISETSSDTTSYESTIPTTENASAVPAEIHNFTASWQTDEDDVDCVVVNWSEESHKKQETGWKLILSTELETQSLIINYDCSREEKSGEYQVKLEKLLPNRYFPACNDSDQDEYFGLIIKPCVLYELSLIPVHGKHQLAKKTKLKPFVKRPSKIESSYNVNQSNLVIRWEPSHEDLNCTLKYRYSLNVDQVGNISETTDNRRIEFKVDRCTHYSIAIWSIGVDNNNEIVSSEPARHTGRTDNQDFDMTNLQTNARAINKTCLIVTWSMNRNIQQLVNCGYSFQILLDPPSEVGQSLWVLGDNKQIQEEMLCHLRPKTEYKFRVEVLDNREGIERIRLPHSSSAIASVRTPNGLDTITMVLILVLSLLFVMLVFFAAYCYWSLRLRHGKESQVANQSFRLKSSFFGKINRRCSRPVKVRNLKTVTQRLCSSAGQLLEMEFEDLTIMADSRRPKDAPIALLTTNAIKNRYVNVLPYEHTRVPLTLLPDLPDSEYINASYVVGFNDPKEYIATQGPKTNTIGDFWRMIWEQNVFIIIMVTSLEEKGKSKCDRYWPEDAETPLICGDLSISLLNETDFENHIIRSLEVKSSENSRIVNQAYLKGWPDFRVPECPEILIRFVEFIRILVNETPSSPNRPIVVHCSAGVGRTGTFIAVDWLIQAARLQKEIDIFTTVLRMRECRINMVQSEEQYEYVYRCLSHFANTRLFSSVNVEDTSDTDAENSLTNGNKQLLKEVA